MTAKETRKQQRQTTAKPRQLSEDTNGKHNKGLISVQYVLVPPATKMGWSCHACTFRNMNDVSKECITCGTKRPKPVKKEDSIDLTREDDGDNSLSKKRSVSEEPHQRTLFGGLVGGANDSNETKAASKRAKTVGNDATTTGPSSKTTQQSTLTLNSNNKSAASYRKLSEDTFAVRKTRCKEVLKDVFHINKLRNQQPKAVECALKGKSQIIVMATGGGKSLCYQLPAVVCGGTTIVSVCHSFLSQSTARPFP